MKIHLFGVVFFLVYELRARNTEESHIAGYFEWARTRFTGPS